MHFSNHILNNYHIKCNDLKQKKLKKVTTDIFFLFRTEVKVQSYWGTDIDATKWKFQPKPKQVSQIS